MDEKSMKMNDLESVRSGQEASIVEPGSPMNENDGEDDALDALPKQDQVQGLDIDEDLLEIIRSFKNNQEALGKLLRKDHRLPVEDLIVFKDKADDIIGYELNSFVDFVSNKYSLNKTKFMLNWDTIMDALYKWAAFQTEDRKRERVEDWMDDNQKEDIYPDLQEDDILDTEKYSQRERCKDLLTMKLLKNLDQIHDIFKASTDHDQSDGESDEENNNDVPDQVRISRLPKVIKDMGLLTGIVFSTWEDYISGEVDEKRTKKDIVERIKKVMWKESHKNVCISVHLGKGKKNGDGILKRGNATNGFEINKKQEKDENGINNQTENQDNTEKDDKSEKSSKYDQTEKTVKDDQTEKTGKDDQTEKQDDDSESDGKSNVSPSRRPDTSKSESQSSATTRRTKTVAGDARTEGEVKDEEELKNSHRAVLFEEDAYLIENKVNLIDVDTFKYLLTEFFDENEDIIILDHLHEYDDQIDEAFKAATDVNYDPFKEKLRKTLEQYENTLIKGDFKDNKEREATENIVKDIKSQIMMINKSRSQTTNTDRENKKQPPTLEELRRRGLKKLFQFY
jgi:hypothetical protein